MATGGERAQKDTRHTNTLPSPTPTPSMPPMNTPGTAINTTPMNHTVANVQLLHDTCGHAMPYQQTYAGPYPPSPPPSKLPVVDLGIPAEQVAEQTMEKGQGLRGPVRDELGDPLRYGPDR